MSICAHRPAATATEPSHSSHSVTAIPGGHGLSEWAEEPLDLALSVSRFLEAEAGFSFGGNPEEWP